MAVVKHLITVYKGRNSPVSFDIKLNDGDYNLSSENVSKIGIVIGGVEYDSDDNYIEYVGSTVTFKLGSIPNPPAQKLSGRLVIYSNKYPLGRTIYSEKTDHRLYFEFI